MALNNIFNKPFLLPSVEVGGIKTESFYIYPVQMSDYDEFQEYSEILYISKDYFNNADKPLLVLLFTSRIDLGLTIENFIDVFCKLFSIVTKKEVTFSSVSYKEGFMVDNEIIINPNNYEIVREIIMKQNVMFERKVFKSKIVQDWAMKVLESKMKGHAKIGIEEMLTTVSTRTGKHYWDLEKYSIYQIYSEFYRIRKGKEYDFSMMAACQGAEIDSIDFAEDLDLYKSPYDDLFVDNDKLNKFN